MENHELIQKAIEVLQRLDPEKLETVSIRTGNYEDGSKSLEIEISWPAEEQEGTEDENNQ
ncbi:hypothetical protein D920_01732 [Enterococcus faecalis 13-SD-W-01]|nr:hypothetical protein D920_01732 [Enterococcus faecalis 13-SD-W-01]